MPRYGSDFEDRGMLGRGEYAGTYRDRAPRGYALDMNSVRRHRGYDLGYGAGGGARAARREHWSDPSRDLAEGYGDYGSRGRYGGYYGAWDTLPLRAGGGYPESGRYDTTYRGGRRRGYDRG